MIIYGGTRERTIQLGYVADYCPICREIRVCRATRVESYSHLYFVRLSKVTILRHDVHCVTCRSHIHDDTSGYASLVRSKRMPLPDLLLATNPTLEERLLEYLETEERAIQGDATEEERFNLLAAPFWSIEREVRARHDGITLGGWSILILLAFIGTVVLFMMSQTTRRPSLLIASLSPFAGGAAVGLLITFIIHLAKRTRSYVQRRFGTYLVDALRDFDPTSEELDDLLDHLTNDGCVGAQKINRAWLDEQLRNAPALSIDDR